MSIDREELEFKFITSMCFKINLRLFTIYLPGECYKMIIIQRLHNRIYRMLNIIIFFVKVKVAVQIRSIIF